MAKTDTPVVTRGFMQVPVSELDEASVRLNSVCCALRGFIALMIGFNRESELNSVHLYHLLTPIALEAEAALDELNVALNNRVPS